jgi:RHS repeat-associated protein
VVNAQTGAVAQRMTYDEYGRVLEDTNPGFQPFGFAGGLYDPDTGLVRFATRDYDAQAGRWTAKDQARFGGGDTNLYAYVKGDPVNQVDPTGMWPEMSPGSIKDWATNETKQKWPDSADGTPNPARHNGEGDAFRHCLGSCEVAREYGSGISEALGDAHEMRGDWNGQPEGEKKMDKHNNECGRKRAEKAKKKEDCIKECEDALKDGSLMKAPPPPDPTFTESLTQFIQVTTTGIQTPMGPISIGWW